MDIIKNEYLISTDNNKLNIEFIFNFLTNDSNWSKGISLEKAEKAITNSLNFGVYFGHKQVGYAKVISDF